MVSSFSCASAGFELLDKSFCVSGCSPLSLTSFAIRSDNGFKSIPVDESSLDAFFSCFDLVDSRIHADFDSFAGSSFLMSDELSVASFFVFRDRRNHTLSPLDVDLSVLLPFFVLKAAPMKKMDVSGWPQQ
jgi:hypothetical protein